MYISTITIIKNSDYEGIASVKLIDDDFNLMLNKITIDTSNGAEPVQVLKHGSTPVISGTLVEDLKVQLLEIFQESLSNKEAGVYSIDESGVTKL